MQRLFNRVRVDNCINKIENSLMHVVNSSIHRKMSGNLPWNVKGVLLDITGVLYESGHINAIPGSIEAVKKLRKFHIPFRFVTNETQRTRASLVRKLQSFGFDISDNEVFSPGLVTSSYVKQKLLHPYLLIHPDIMPEFAECDQTSPNCVIIGDASDYFSYENMNKAFKVLISSEQPVLISMGKGRFYREKDELLMDLGGFTAALEYATGTEAKIIGKPSPEFFLSALNDISVNTDEAVMVGDDINSDIHASQKCGLKGVMVKTGKFRPADMENPNVKPDLFVENLAQFVDMLCCKNS